MLAEIRNVNRNVDARFGRFEIQFKDLRGELFQMKTGMVTPTQFESLETRVYSLETQTTSPDNPDIKFLQAQLDRFDPAHKCVSICFF